MRSTLTKTATQPFGSIAVVQRLLCLGYLSASCLLCAAFVLSICADDLEAQSRRKNRKMHRRGKIQQRSLTSAFDLLNNNEALEFSFDGQVDEIITTSADTTLYDPLTIEHLKRLKEQAQPFWNPDDIDPEKTRRVVEKALALQTTTSVSRLVKKSELQDTYRHLYRSFKRFKDTFRYSLQSGSNGLSISNRPEGQNLVEFNMEFNAKHGLDPQLRIGDAVRFRYDYVERRPLLEYGFNF